ncbi:hypothetical protein B9Z19DRAFT_1121873 [Tuber borchii]|uniref:Uncharacterized protein n=1 Tax=Tuber borchii TaxID=42251 RepID=A0A2T7A1X6_TUBBO|nr:hypothetical protein B9Z19DRAFT_1121873 [Tuber borchii]
MSPVFLILISGTSCEGLEVEHQLKFQNEGVLKLKERFEGLQNTIGSVLSKTASRMLPRTMAALKKPKNLPNELVASDSPF